MTKNNDKKIEDVQENQLSDDVVVGEPTPLESESIEVSGEADGHLKQLEEKVGGLEDQLKRAVADYRNLERRIQEDGLALAQYSRSQLLVQLLPVLDHLDQALAGAEASESQSGWYKGVEMAVKQFKTVLSEEGLEEIEAHNHFDPVLHEAVDVQVGEDGKVLKILQNGYKLNGKVLRPTKVVVGKKGDIKN